MQTPCAQSRLIVALDFSDPDVAYEFCLALNLRKVVYKIGLELLFSGGMRLAQRLVKEGYTVFIDAKLLDIAHTVERATSRIAEIGAHFLTVHAHSEATLEAAQRAASASHLRLLGVTVLTDLDTKMLLAGGYAETADALVHRRAGFAASCGLYGVVASPQEATMLKAAYGPRLAIVTPGIRLATQAETVFNDDQVRTATPKEAILAGADYIVVGRPIRYAANPSEAAQAIAQDIEVALATAAHQT